MFPKQVNFRELFSNPGAYLNTKLGDLGDSQSSSQFIYSQSNSDSLDPGSQNSLNNSPGKSFSINNGGSRVWKRQNSQENINTRLPSGMKITNQPLYNNIFRAKDRDERDLLRSILNNVRDSSSEVLTALALIQDNINNSEKAKTSQSECYLEKVIEAITKSNKEIAAVLEAKESQKSEEIELRRLLIEKDAKLEDLENQLHACKEENNNTLIERINQMLERHQQKIEDLIKELYNKYKDDIEILAKQENKGQTTELEDVQKYFTRLENLQETRYSDWSSKFSYLGEKLQEVVHQSRSVNAKLVKDIRESFKSTKKHLKSEVERILEQQMKSLTVKNSSESCCDEIYRCLEIHNKEIHVKLEKLFTEYEKTVTSAVKECLAAEKGHCEEKYKEAQQNMYQKIENVVRRLEISYKEEFGKVLLQSKDLKRLSTPILLPGVIPPPTPEQYKQHTASSIPQQNLASGVIPRNTRANIMVQESEMSTPVNQKNINQKQHLRNQTILTPMPVSKIIWNTSLLSDGCANPSPVTNVSHQLVTEKDVIDTKQTSMKNTQMETINRTPEIVVERSKKSTKQLHRQTRRDVESSKQVPNNNNRDVSHKNVHTIHTDNKNRKLVNKSKNVGSKRNRQAQQLSPLRTKREGTKKKLGSKTRDKSTSGHRYFMRQRVTDTSSVDKTLQDCIFVTHTCDNNSSDSPSSSEHIPKEKKTRLDVTSYTNTQAAFTSSTTDMYIFDDDEECNPNSLIKAKDVLAWNSIMWEKSRMVRVSSVKEDGKKSRFEDNNIRNNTNRVEQEHMEDEEDESRNSSPSLSVTEIVIRRRKYKGAQNDITWMDDDGVF